MKQHHSVRRHRKELTKLDDFAFMVDALRAEPLLQAKWFAWAMIKEHVIASDPYYGTAKKIKEITKTKYVIFGHTHGPRQREFYLNTGTWASSIIMNAKGKLVKNKKLSYVHIVNNHASLKEWK